jgi:hypothetical protein
MNLRSAEGGRQPEGHENLRSAEGGRQPEGHENLRSAVLFGTALAAVLAATPAHAAKEFGLGAAYDPRLPVGSFRSFTPDAAFVGFQLKWDFFPLDSLSTGLAVQYHLFRRGLETNTLPLPTGAITAPSFHYATFWSFVPTARYYLKSRTIQPYVELGVGAAAVASNVLVSDLGQHFAGGALVVQPSIGALWRLHTDDSENAERAEVERDLASRGAPARSPRRVDHMFGLTASFTYSYTTADVVGARNVAYAGFQFGVYAKP